MLPSMYRESASEKLYKAAHIHRIWTLRIHFLTHVGAALARVIRSLTKIRTRQRPVLERLPISWKGLQGLDLSRKSQFTRISFTKMSPTPD